MYAIIKVGSSQYKVSEGDTIATNRILEESGKTYSIDEVLLYADGKDIRVGQPHLKDVKVTAQVLDHHRGKKTIAFKYRRRKASATIRGHRQQLTTLNITKIAVK